MGYTSAQCHLWTPPLLPDRSLWLCSLDVHFVPICRVRHSTLVVRCLSSCLPQMEGQGNILFICASLWPQNSSSHKSRHLSNAELENGIRQAGLSFFLLTSLRCCHLSLSLHSCSGPVLAISGTWPIANFQAASGSQCSCLAGSVSLECMCVLGAMGAAPASEGVSGSLGSFQHLLRSPHMPRRGPLSSHFREFGAHNTHPNLLIGKI
jgi:hypothetical protein